MRRRIQRSKSKNTLKRTHVKNKETCKNKQQQQQQAATSSNNKQNKAKQQEATLLPPLSSHFTYTRVRVQILVKSAKKQSKTKTTFPPLILLTRVCRYWSNQRNGDAVADRPKEEHLQARAGRIRCVRSIYTLLFSFASIHTKE